MSKNNNSNVAGANNNDELAKKQSKAIESDIPDEYMAIKCKTLGKNIRFERKVRGFSIDDLSECIELSSSYVGLLERGERCPSLKSLLRICELFGGTPNDFLLDKNAQYSRVAIGEPRKSAHKNKFDAIVSLLQGLDEAELDFVISSIKNLKQLGKKQNEK